MKTEKILFQIKETLIDILNSPRWFNPNQPIMFKIKDIGERVKSPESLKKFREIEDFVPLFDIVNTFEESFNEDWLPFEIFDMKLNESRLFLEGILQEFDNIQEGDWTASLTHIYQTTKNQNRTI